MRRAIDSINGTTPSGIRDRAILLLLATTGICNRELRELELGDIRWRSGELLLRHTKGDHDRIPIYGLGLQSLEGGELVVGGTAILMHATISGVSGGNPLQACAESHGCTEELS